MVTKKKYVPERGDVVWVDLDPHKGREQAHVRPAIIVSPRIYNERSGLALVCPITSHVKEYPFEVVVVGKKIAGVALVDQVRSIDWQERRVSFVEKVSSETLKEIQAKIVVLVTG
jgi:mRNA interferase MazF